MCTSINNVSAGKGIFMAPIDRTNGTGGPKRPNNTDRPEGSSREFTVKRQRTSAVKSQAPTAETQKTDKAKALYTDVTSGQIKTNQNHNATTGVLNNSDLIKKIEEFGFPLAGALRGNPKTTAGALSTAAQPTEFQKNIGVELENKGIPVPYGLTEPEPQKVGLTSAAAPQP